MILDAGCANRCMWRYKNNPNIIFLDRQKKLERKPDIYASNTNLPFKNDTFDTVFYDPPHAWNIPTHPFYSYPNNTELHAKYPDMKQRGFAPSYYGIELYKTREELVKYIYEAEKELYRVLKSDGVMWLRWSNLKTMSEKQALNLFPRWVTCTVHEIRSSHETLSSMGSFWFMLMKKPAS
jgi:hypothetical protein